MNIIISIIGWIFIICGILYTLLVLFICIYEASRDQDLRHLEAIAKKQGIMDIPRTLWIGGTRGLIAILIGALIIKYLVN